MVGEIDAHRLASRIGDWCVLEVITLSDHQCIEFSIQERSHPGNAGRGVKGRAPSGTQDDSAKTSFGKILKKLDS